MPNIEYIICILCSQSVFSSVMHSIALGFKIFYPLLSLDKKGLLFFLLNLKREKFPETEM